METLERSRVCRLCGKHAGIAIDIFDKGGNHVKKINAVLPILVHEMDLLPKHICHPCNYKLQEFHKFYEDCLKTDANLKGQLSWMQGSMKHGESGVPMVQINNIIIKTEPLDYDEQVATDAVFHSRNLNNYLGNNCTSYPERIFTSSKTECSQCGCYCSNKNLDELPKTKPTQDDNEKNNNERFTMRDTIKRNLFTTEIFGDKIPKIQTEIPVGSIPQGIMCPQNGRRGASKIKMSANDDKMAANENKMAVNTNNMAENTNKMAVNTNKMVANANKMAVNADKMAANSIKMAGGTNKMAARKLRPRKTCSSTNPHQLPVAAVTSGPTSKFSSKKVTNSIDSNTLESVPIKLEVLEDLRSLRPRMDVIDYSDSKRKNPLARTADRKRQKISESHVEPSLATPAVAIKIEPKEFPEMPDFSASQKTAKILSPPRRVLKKAPKIIFEQFLKSAFNEQNLGIKSAKSENSRRSRTKLPKITRQKNLPEYRENPNFRYLRSQRGQLRNGKLKTIDYIVEKPKKIHNVTSELNGVPIKREKFTDDEKSEQINVKHRDCNTCNCRFANAELYMLHHCYANKRH